MTDSLVTQYMFPSDQLLYENWFTEPIIFSDVVLYGIKCTSKSRTYRANCLQIYRTAKNKIKIKKSRNVSYELIQKVIPK